MATINKVKTSAYNGVNEENVIRYITEHAQVINNAILNDTLKGRNMAKLKTIAAELETVTRYIKYFEQGY